MNNEEIMENAVDKSGLFGHIDNAIEFLAEAKKNGENIFINFNDVKLYSMIDDRDSCYLKVTGEDYLTFKKNSEMDSEKIKREIEEKLIKEQIEALDKIPERIERGLKLIYPQNAKQWEKMVSEQSCQGMYLGHDIDVALDIMENLENNVDFETIYNQFEAVGNYNLLVLNNILMYSKEGVAFFKFIHEKDGESLTPQMTFMLDRIDRKNKQFEDELAGLERE